jgi:hypothetical protein
MDSPAQAAAKKLSWEVESRKSVEVKVTTTITDHRAGTRKEPDFNTITEHYIETAAGQRYCDFRGLKSGELHSHLTHFGDGSKFADLNYDPNDWEVQQNVFIKKQYWMEEGSDHKQVPQPLLFLYVGREPLHEALPRAEYLGKGQVIGRDCNLFLFVGVRWTPTQDQVFHLDEATAIPLKVESYRNKEARDKHEPMGSWTAKSLEVVQGHPVPMTSTLVQLGGDHNPMFTWDYKVDSIQFDNHYPASMFWPTFQPGVTVFDSFTKKNYTVPGAAATKPGAAKTAEGSVQPIQATPPRDWSAFAPGAFLVVGLALLLTGGIAWWRRR